MSNWIWVFYLPFGKLSSSSVLSRADPPRVPAFVLSLQLPGGAAAAAPRPAPVTLPQPRKPPKRRGCKVESGRPRSTGRGEWASAGQRYHLRPAGGAPGPWSLSSLGVSSKSWNQAPPFLILFTLSGGNYSRIIITIIIWICKIHVRMYPTLLMLIRSQ